MTREIPRIRVDCDCCGSEFYFEMHPNELDAHLEMVGWTQREISVTETQDICPSCSATRLSVEESVIMVELERDPKGDKFSYRAMGTGEMRDITGRGKVLILHSPPKMPHMGAHLIHKMRVFEVDGAEYQGMWTKHETIGCVVQQIFGAEIDGLAVPDEE